MKCGASGEYILHQYIFLKIKLIINFTGARTISEWEILLPTNNRPKILQVNGGAKPLIINRIESSDYLVFSVDGIRVIRIEVDFMQNNT